MAQQLTLATASGEMHGLINTLTNCVPFDEFKNFKPEHKKEMERQKKENGRLVKAEYMNSRGRHERLTKPFCLGSGEPIQIWHFIPGKIYEIPLGLVKEVNDKNKVMKKRAGLISEDGIEVQKSGAPIEEDQEGEWLHRFVAEAF
ncbi:MAG TPA: hypothetical protein VMT35_07550 [Ignavibacteriaceae bacterium]|nr:hypothetical protein [Ignavibacteriaceae bacterium]